MYWQSVSPCSFLRTRDSSCHEIESGRKKRQVVAIRKQIDFTEGSMLSSIVVFAVPLMTGELLQNLYNSVDAIIVGNFVGEEALAAVTVCSIITNLVTNFFNGMSVGANVVVSCAFGARNEEKLLKSIRVSFSFALFLGACFSALGALFTPQILSVADPIEEYYTQALSYLRIYMGGLLFTVVYNSGAGIMRAIGDSRTPFCVLTMTCALNAVLDIIFVRGFGMGVAGAAVATVIAQAISAILIYCALCRTCKIQCIDFYEMFRVGGEVIKQILAVGFPAGIQSAVIGLSNLFVVRYMNLFDTVTVAGIGIAQRLDRFIMMPAKTFGITITTCVSQNIGAQQPARIKEGKNKCMIASLTVTVVLCIIVLSFSKECVALFNSNPDVISVGVAMMRVLIPLFPIIGVRDVYIGYLRGYGKTFWPTVAMLTGMVGVRQLYLLIAMKRNLTEENIYFCYPIAWIASLLLVMIYYFAVRSDCIKEERP